MKHHFDLGFHYITVIHMWHDKHKINMTISFYTSTIWLLTENNVTLSFWKKILSRETQSLNHSNCWNPHLLLPLQFQIDSPPPDLLHIAQLLAFSNFSSLLILTVPIPNLLVVVAAVVIILLLKPGFCFEIVVFFLATQVPVLKLLHPWQYWS